MIDEHTINRLFSQLSGHLIPKQCPFCDANLSAAEHIACHQCYTALPWAAAPSTTLNELSAFYYLPPIKEYILAGKTGKQLDKLQTLGQLLADNLSQRVIRKPEAIIPVPLHKTRLRQRGFNQSIELAKPLAKQLGIPLLSHVVSRTRHTKDQKGLLAGQRQLNMQQAFALTGALPYSHLALFDDVITTGATCSVLRDLLLEHGITTVEIWCCATTKQ